MPQYGLVERKCGRPMPEDNRLVEDGKQKPDHQQHRTTWHPETCASRDLVFCPARQKIARAARAASSVRVSGQLSQTAAPGCVYLAQSGGESGSSCRASPRRSGRCRPGRRRGWTKRSPRRRRSWSRTTTSSPVRGLEAMTWPFLGRFSAPGGVGLNGVAPNHPGGNPRILCSGCSWAEFLLPPQRFHTCYADTTRIGIIALPIQILHHEAGLRRHVQLQGSDSTAIFLGAGIEEPAVRLTRDKSVDVGAHFDAAEME